MTPTTSVSPLAFVHPVLVGLGFVLAVLVFNQGLKQRDQRVKRTPAPTGNRARHVAMGPWVVGLILVGAVGGLVSTVVLRGWRPLGTWHGRLGVAATGLFTLEWVFGRRVLEQRGSAARHGLVGLAAVAFGGLASLLGIELLP